MKKSKQKIGYPFAATFSVSLLGLAMAVFSPTVSASAQSPLSGTTFYSDPTTNFAANQVREWSVSRPADAEQLKKISSQPKAFWMGDWTPLSQQVAADYTNRATGAGQTGVIVAYNIPLRDCNSFSAGGARSYQEYNSWIDGLAAGIGSKKTVVILEPDALAQLSCLDETNKQARLASLTYAVNKLKTTSAAIVYVDGGNKGWIGAAEMASLLQKVNIAAADGFALNISNFYTTAETSVYGNDLSSRIGNKHYVIDTSRNGAGSNGEWCNPTNRALGQAPTTQTGNQLADAFLWIKGPGESDGTCNGGPAAGAWWPDYALGLAQRTGVAPAPASVPAPVKPAATVQPKTIKTATPSTPEKPAASKVETSQSKTTRPVSLKVSDNPNATNKQVTPFNSMLYVAVLLGTAIFGLVTFFRQRRLSVQRPKK